MVINQQKGDTVSDIIGSSRVRLRTPNCRSFSFATSQIRIVSPSNSIMRTHVCECSVLVKNVGCTRIEQRGSLSDTSSPAACRWRNSDKEPHRCHSFFSQCYTLRCLKGIQLYNPLSAVLRNHQPLKKKIKHTSFTFLVTYRVKIIREATHDSNL